MTVFDIIRINASNMEALRKYNINLEDVRYIDLYTEYRQMVAVPQLKVTYIITALSEKYRISERQVWRIISKFGTKIQD